MNTQQLMAYLADQDAERLLLAAYAHGEQATTKVLATALDEEAGYVSDLAEQLQQLDLAIFVQTLGDDFMELTPSGRSLARKIQQSFASGGRRTEAIRRGVLHSVRAKRKVFSTDLAENWTGQPLNPPASHDEIAQAFAFLRERNMINAQGTMQGVYIGIGITPAGLDALEHGLRLVTPESTPMLNDYRDMRNQSNNFVQHGGTVGAVGVGNQNTITGTVTLGPDQVVQIRKALQEALVLAADLPETTRQPVSEALDDALEVASEDNPKPRLLRRCIEDGTTALSSSVGSAAGTTIMGLLQGLLNMV